jgi:hypothetical protein
MIIMSPEQNGQGYPCPFHNNLGPIDLLHFGQMGHCAFGMLCGYIGMTRLAVLNTFLEMLDRFIDVRILRGSPGVLECLLTMLHGSIGMALFAMCHSFLGMFQGFTDMLVCCKGKPAEQWETNKRGNRRNDQCSAMDSLLHGSLLSN